jgi:hypothetical protein
VQAPGDPLVVPFGPILSTIAAPTYRLAQHLSSLLGGPAMLEVSESYVIIGSDVGTFGTSTVMNLWVP